MIGYPLESGAGQENPSLNDSFRTLAAMLLTQGKIQHIMIPARTSEDAWQWMLVSDPGSLENTDVLPPIMPVQGARALASFAHDTSCGRTLAVMRPCEVRAAVELSKLEQIDLNGIILMSMDCPGVVTLDDFRNGRVTEPDPRDPETLRPLCSQCTEFTAAGDVTLAGQDGSFYLVPLTDGGRSFLDSFDHSEGEDLDSWGKNTEKLRSERQSNRDRSQKALREESAGLQGLVDLFGSCVGCRACRKVCPICYCNLCFIDMRDRRLPASDYLRRASQAGATRLLSGTLLFHMGRMAHMSLSCVSCGMCQDACPSNIPVGELVSMVASSTASLFDYRAGEDPKVPPPLSTFITEELHEFED